MDDDKKTPAMGSPAQPDRRSWETWAADKKVPYSKANAARHGRAWPIGQEVTEDEFNQALYDAFNARIG